MSATPKAVRPAAMPNSLLAMCINTYNRMLGYLDGHTHAAFPAVPTVLANTVVPKIVDSRGRGPQGLALQGATNNTVYGSRHGSGRSNDADIGLLEAIWKALNDFRDTVDGHTHAAAGTATATGYHVAITGFNDKDPAGVNWVKSAQRRVLFSGMSPGAERDALSELIVQMNQLFNWFNQHTHTGGAGTSPNNTTGSNSPPISKVGDLTGRDPVTGDVLTTGNSFP